MEGDNRKMRFLKVSKLLALCGIVLILLMLLISFINVPNQRGEPEQNKVSLFEFSGMVELLQDGDIIARLGDRFWSQIIREASVDDKRFSHVGVIRMSGVQITVIHAEGTTTRGTDFVKEEPLEDFLQVARSIGIFRLRDSECFELSALALEYIGVPFDWKFNRNDKTTLYCTELIDVIIRRLNPSFYLRDTYIKEFGKEIITIEAVTNSDLFEEVYYLQVR
jgi:hypothetical protein